MSQAAGQSLVRRSASLPPSQNTTEPQKKAPSGPSRRSTSGGDLLGPARSPDRNGQHVEQGARLGIGPHARATIGVSIMPGAMALSRSPAPAQSGPVAWRRTQWATASLVAG